VSGDRTPSPKQSVVLHDSSMGESRVGVTTAVSSDSVGHGVNSVECQTKASPGVSADDRAVIHSTGEASSKPTEASVSCSASSVSVAVPKLSTAESAKCFSPVVPSVEVQRVEASLSSQTDKLGASGDKAVSQIELLCDARKSISGDSGVVRCSSLPLQPTSLSTSTSQMLFSSMASASSSNISGSSSSRTDSKSEVQSGESPQPAVHSKLKRVEDIPAYDESGPTSQQRHYDGLVTFIREHPYVLEGLSSPEFTFDVQITLQSALCWMKRDDPSELAYVSRAYFNSHRISNAEVLRCLEFFCDEHPEILQAERYEDRMSWLRKTRNKLLSLLLNVQNRELQERDTWVNAHKFLRTVPLDLPLR